MGHLQHGAGMGNENSFSNVDGIMMQWSVVAVHSGGRHPL